MLKRNLKKVEKILRKIIMQNSKKIKKRRSIKMKEEFVFCKLKSLGYN